MNDDRHPLRDLVYRLIALAVIIPLTILWLPLIFGFGLPGPADIVAALIDAITR